MELEIADINELSESEVRRAELARHNATEQGRSRKEKSKSDRCGYTAEYIELLEQQKRALIEENEALRNRIQQYDSLSVEFNEMVKQVQESGRNNAVSDIPNQANVTNFVIKLTE